MATELVAGWIVLLGAVVGGIGLKATMAYLQHGKGQFDGRQTFATMIMGFLGSFALVHPMLQPHLEEGMFAINETGLVLFAGLVMTVMGVDSAAKKVGQKIKKPADPLRREDA